MTKVILLLTVFLTPLLPGTYQFGYEQIKVLFFIAGVSIASVFWMFEAKFKWSKIALASDFFLFILFLTSIIGLDFKTSFLGAPPYFQGLILYLYLFLFYILVRESKIKLEVWSKVLVGSAILVSFIAIKDWVLLNMMGVSVPLYAGRVVSSFGQPNFYSGFLLLTLPFAYRLGKFGFIGGLLSFIGILVSYSRSTILLSLALLILGLISKLKIRYKLGGLILGAFFLSIYIAWKLSSGLVGIEISIPQTQINPDLTTESVERRGYIWPLAMEIYSKNLLNGFGLENIPKAFSGYFVKNNHILFEENLKVKPYLFGLKDIYLDRTHNYFLDLLMFSGIFGLASYLILIFLLAKKSWRTVYFLPLIVYLVWIQLQNQSIVQLFYFWLLAGAIDVDKV